MKLIGSRISTFLLFAVVASHGGGVEVPAQGLPANEVEAAVAKICRLTEDNYVFANKGRIIATEFSSSRARVKFNHASDWQEFATAATSALRDASGDGHLYVRYDPRQVKELRQPPPENRKENPGEDNSFFYGEKAREKNYGFTKVEILDGNLGYLKLSEINISGKSLPVLIAALAFVAETKALIVDLRGNGGGGSEIGPVLESFFLPKDVSLLEFRSREGRIETSRTVSWLLERKYDSPLYIVINGKTGSAAEAFAYALQAQKRAVIVGQPSAGAPHMNSWYAVNDFIYLSVSTGAPVLPGTEISWEGKGVQPDFSTKPDEEIEFIKKMTAKK